MTWFLWRKCWKTSWSYVSSSLGGMYELKFIFLKKKWILWISREDEYPYVGQNCSCASAGVCGEEYHNVFTHFYRVFQCYFTRDGAIWWWYIYSNEINNLGAKNKQKIAKKKYKIIHHFWYIWQAVQLEMVGYNSVTVGRVWIMLWKGTFVLFGGRWRSQKFWLAG